MGLGAGVLGVMACRSWFPMSLGIKKLKHRKKGEGGRENKKARKRERRGGHEVVQVGPWR